MLLCYKSKVWRGSGGWSTCVVRVGHGVGLWKTIGKWGHFISNKLSFEVGNEHRVKFWKGKWCRDTLLSNSFPSLFVITFSEEA